MFDKARFEIIGRVGSIKHFENVSRVSIATNDSFKKNGEWIDRTIWNEVTIFDNATRKWIETKLEKGDVVRVEGKLGQSSYKKNGETVYTTDLIVENFSRQPKKPACEPNGSDA